jgi:catechol 2,3-dioxygenase-like lactoylglutathione lyase family enzyme
MRRAPKQALLLALAMTGLTRLWAQTAQRPAITGIAFARFYTTDQPGAQKFYGDTLGFKSLEANGTSIYPVNRSPWIEILTSPPPKADVRMAAVAFTTRNAAGLERYLAAHGVKPELALKAGEFGVRDPEGNLVIFVQHGSNKPVAHAPPSPDATSGRIIHVGFIVQDAAKEDAFWRDLLGFRPYWHGGKTDTRTDYQSIQVPDGTDWLEYMLNQPEHMDLQLTGVMNHISLGVADMKKAQAIMESHGWKPHGDEQAEVGKDGKWQLDVYDPDLTRVELMEFKPVQKPCCNDFTGPHPTE